MKQLNLTHLRSQVLESNSDQDTVVSNSLKSPVVAHFIRLHPRAWNEAIGMRAEFYGFDAGMNSL